MRPQKVNEYTGLPVMVLVVDLNLLSGVARMTISEVQRGYEQYRGIADVDADQPAGVPGDVVDDFDGIFAQETL